MINQSNAASNNRNIHTKKIVLFLCLMAMIAALLLWFGPDKPPPPPLPPLPKGPVKAPSLPAEKYPSNVLFTLRTTIKSMRNILNDRVPKTFDIKVPNITGTLTRNNWNLKPDHSNEQRLRLDGTLKFKGSIKHKRVPFFEVRSGDIKLSNSSISLAIDPNWQWKLAPKINATLTSTDVDWLPDWFAKWLINLFLEYYDLEKFSPPISFKHRVEGLWKQLNRDENIPNITYGTIVTRGKELSINGPLIKQGRLEFSLNINGQVRVTLDKESRGPSPDHFDSLPPAKTEDHFQKKTTLRVPFLVNLQEAATFFKPTELPIETLGGKLRIKEIELSEKDGICYARGKVHLDVPKSQLLANAFSGETVLTTHFRPHCNSETGEIYIDNLEFTSESEAILVELLGTVGSTKPVLNAIRSLAPMASSWFRIKLESHLENRSKKFLSDLKDNLTASLPEIKTEISNAKPYINNITIKPVHLETTGGFLVIVIEASGDIGLNVP